MARSPVRPSANRSSIDGFESVRRAWQQPGGCGQYFFQSPEWMDLAAAQLEGDLAWGVVTESGRPDSVSVLRRSRLKRAGIGIRVLSDVRVADKMYPFSDRRVGLPWLALSAGRHMWRTSQLAARGSWTPAWGPTSGGGRSL